MHGYFVNFEDVFFYAGDTAALNDFLGSYSQLADTRLEVVLHPGNQVAASPWDDEPRGPEIDWKLYASPFSPNEIGQRRIEPTPFVTRVDVWLGGGIKLEELVVPTEVLARSGGEIEAFVRKHQQQRDGVIENE